PQLLSEVLVWRTAIAVPVFAAAAVAGLALMPGGGSTVAFLLILLASFVDIYTDAGRAAAGAKQDLRGVSVAVGVQGVVTAGLARAVYPMMSAATEPSRVRVGLERAVAAVAVVYVPFGVALWIDAGPIMRVLYGSSYAAGGVSVVRWLAAAPLVFAFGFLANF